VDAADDPGLVMVLEHFGLRAAAPLGRGGEACVYALDAERVIRVLHAGAGLEGARAAQALVVELGRATPRAAFALPEVLEHGEIAGRAYTVERRLPGRSVMDELGSLGGDARGRLIEAHLDTAAALGDLDLDRRPWFGDLVVADPVTAPTWPGFLVAKVARSLAAAGPEFAAIDPGALADALAAPRRSEVTEGTFVHLDAFAGNMLTDGSRITAVIDIGPSSVAGDRRVDPVATAVYLCAPLITPPMRPGDPDVARSWLRSAGLDDWFDPLRRWLAAYWAFAVDDVALHQWCRSVLVDGG
jgi:putative membrane protein